MACVQLYDMNIRVELPAYKVDIDNGKLQGTMKRAFGVQNNHREYKNEGWYVMDISGFGEHFSPLFLMMRELSTTQSGILVGLSKCAQEVSHLQNSRIVGLQPVVLVVLSPRNLRAPKVFNNEKSSKCTHTLHNIHVKFFQDSTSCEY